MNNLEISRTTLPHSEQLTELQNKYQKCERSLSAQRAKRNKIGVSLHNTTQAIDQVYSVFGGGGPASKNSVQKALTDLNSEYTKSFSSVGDVILSMNETATNTLDMIKILAILQARAFVEIQGSSQAHSKAAERLHNVADKLQKGEIELSEFIDLFDEVASSQEQRFARIEKQLDQFNLQNNNLKAELEIVAGQLTLSIKESAERQMQSIRELGDKKERDLEKRSEQAIQQADNEISKIKTVCSQLETQIKKAEGLGTEVLKQISNKSEESTQAFEHLVGIKTKEFEKAKNDASNELVIALEKQKEELRKQNKQLSKKLFMYSVFSIIASVLSTIMIIKYLL